MKTLLEDALSRDDKPVSTAPAVNEDMRADTELESLLAEMKTKVRIFGCGGSGCNTIARMMEEGITGAELFAANTDAQHLLATPAPKKILLGRRVTKGLGAGAQIEIIRSGEVIPKLDKVFKTATRVTLPENCPCCKKYR